MYKQIIIHFGVIYFGHVDKTTVCSIKRAEEIALINGYKSASDFISNREGHTLTINNAGEMIGCPYCSGSIHLVSGQIVYPHRKDLYSKKFYICQPCDAYVGCHGTSDQPLGRLADRRLREWKQAAHAAFDPLWKSGKMKRGEAYGWLADCLGIEKEKCHIGMFDVIKCKEVVRICREGV